MRLLLLTAAAPLAGGVQIGQIFSPVWHTVNDFDRNGVACSTRLPAVEVKCPQFGVHAEGALGQDEVERRCAAAGYATCGADEHLFPDGKCQKCPDNKQAVEEDDTIFCQSPTDPDDFVTFSNPFACLRHSTYRACDPGDKFDTAVIDRYYKGNDAQFQSTLMECAAQAGLQDNSTTVRLVDKYDVTVPFPLLHLSHETKDFGFLQCPLGEPTPYNFASALWIFYYCAFGVAFSFIAGFALRKRVEERKLKGSAAFRVLSGAEGEEADDTAEPSPQEEASPRNLPNRDSASEAEGAARSKKHSLSQSTRRTVQRGYRESMSGTLGYVLVWMISLLWIVWLFLIILDYYGLMWRTCDAQTRAACMADFKLDHSVSWRTGYSCGAACVFGDAHTTGSMQTWPWYKFAGGGSQINAIFIASWHLAVAWFALLIFLKQQLRTFFRIRCSLSEASLVVMGKAREREILVATDEQAWETKLTSFISVCNERIFGPAMIMQPCKVMRDSRGQKYFDFQCMRYTWDEYRKAYVNISLRVGDGSQLSLRSARAGLSTSAAMYRLERVGANTISVPVPSIGSSIAAEYYSGFYLYQFACLVVWFAFYYYTMGLLILTIIIITGGIQIRSRRKCQKKVKALAELVSTVHVLRDDVWTQLPSSLLVPGDIILVEAGAELAADCVLIDGRCVVNESSRTGEAMPVPKIPVEYSTKEFTGGSADMKYTLHAGTTVESTASGQTTGRTMALVMTTGAQTGRGQLVREILYPPPMTFKFDLHWQVVFVLLIVWGLIIFGVCFYFINGHLVSWFYGIFTISQIMSPLIPAVFVIGRSQAANRLRDVHDIYCTNIDRVAVAGKVRIFAFDKTGTLTKSGLDFMGVDLMDKLVERNHRGEMVPPSFVNPRNAPLHVANALAVCHELDAVPAKVAGDASLDAEVPAVRQTRMSRAADFFRRAADRLRGKSPRGRTESDDGVALADVGLDRMNSVFATEFGLYKMVGNEVDLKMFEASGATMIDFTAQPTVELRPTLRRQKVLRRFEFDREAMAMSVIVEDLESGGRYVYTKGSHEALRGMSVEQSIPPDFGERTRGLAAMGFYVLASGWKEFDGEEDVNLADRSTVEKDLNFLCLLIFENRLKDDTSDVICELKRGATRTVIITGDNAQTAAKIAKECGLTSAARLLLADLAAEGEVVWSDIKTEEAVDDLWELLPQMAAGEVHLAVTGHALELLKESAHVEENYDMLDAQLLTERRDGTGRRPRSIPFATLLPHTRIFARMNPDQKVEVVRLLMALGITAMCGDGANDAGALRMAHVGLAVSSGAQSATIVSPFSTPHGSLKAATRILKEGRGALANSMAGYKNLIMYGEIMVILSVTQYYFGIILSEAFWIFVDSFINIGMAWAIMQAKPSEKLAPSRPTCKLIGLEVFTSVISQILLDAIIVVIAINMLFAQDWFVCKEFDANLIDPAKWWLKGDNFESAVLASVILFQFVNSAAVFNIGFDYRQAWIRNFWVIGFWVAGLAFSTYLVFSQPSFFSCLFRMNCGDDSLLKRWSELGLVSYSGPIPLAPEGCSCDTQVSESATCENEYIYCANDKYSQTYHHNIVPYSFRWKVFLLVLANIAGAFVIEGVVIVGPVRRWLRRRAKRQRGDGSDSEEREGLSDDRGSEIGGDLGGSSSEDEETDEAIEVDVLEVHADEMLEVDWEEATQGHDDKT